MAWSVPKTWTSGSAVTAAELNQEVRDNLNALRAERVVGGYTEGTWTPTGSGITFVSAGGNYTKVGRIYIIEGYAQWPVTSEVGGANIQGLPMTVLQDGGLAVGYTTYGSPITIQPVNGATYATIYDYYGTALTNAQMSNIWIKFSGVITS